MRRTGWSGCTSRSSSRWGPQYLVILALLDGAPQTVGALGARLDMDAGTITPLVKRLEAAGMVSRVRDRTDERRQRVAAWSRRITGCLRAPPSSAPSAIWRCLCLFGTVDTPRPSIR
ncbi:MarR family winged helix-turn-helix transcriptional regulator [Mycobacterium sp. MYCO198283]|nr:MarR family winged helix-turn-helix transcriptional regulator [Mycobacterium sp. MYCO198283]